MKYLLLILCFFLLPKTAKSCINEYRTLMDGSVIMTEAQSAIPSGKYNLDNKKELLDRLNKAESIYKMSNKLYDYSDYATMLIYNGQLEKARDIFLSIEKQKANLYITAANLGTTYELLGKNDSAIYWLTRAITINPDSHNGSEWIHLKVLEAKMLSNGDEKILSNIDILNLGFGDEVIPKNPSAFNGKLNIIQIETQLYIQLTERMTFIKPKDPVVGKLLFDLGNVCAITKDLKSAIEIYQKAREYGFNSDLLDKRERHFKSLQLKADLRNNTEGWVRHNPGAFLLFASIILVLILSGILHYLTKKNRSE